MQHWFSETTLVRDATSFTGKAGYARPNQLALFEGSQLALMDFQVRRSGDFALSAAVIDSGVSGRIAGRAGGHACVAPPTAFDPMQAQVEISGRTGPVRDRGWRGLL